MIVYEGYCAHNHYLQVTPANTMKLKFLFKKQNKTKQKVHSHKKIILIIIQSMTFPLIGNILILFYTGKAIKIIYFFFEQFSNDCWK